MSPRADRTAEAPQADPPQFAQWRPAPRTNPMHAVAVRTVFMLALYATGVGAALAVASHEVYAPMLLVLAFVLAIVGLLCLRRNRSLPQIDVALDQPDTVRQTPVNVLFTWRGIVYGQDTGYVSFIDGWLVFAGARTDFALHSSDVVRLKSYGNPTKLEWNSGSFVGIIHLRPVDPGLLAVQERPTLEAEVASWLQLRSNKVGTSPFPPRTPKPGLRQGLRRQRSLLFAAVLSAGAAVVPCTFYGAGHGFNTVHFIYSFVSLSIPSAVALAMAAFIGCQLRELGQMVDSPQSE